MTTNIFMTFMSFMTTKTLKLYLMLHLASQITRTKFICYYFKQKKMAKMGKIANVSFIKQICMPEIKFKTTMDLFSIHMQGMIVATPNQPT